MEWSVAKVEVFKGLKQTITKLPGQMDVIIRKTATWIWKEVSFKNKRQTRDSDQSIAKSETTGR